MAKTLATFYMETMWLKMGNLRNVKLLHKLFNVCYGIRKAEYMAQIVALPQSNYQAERGQMIRLMLELTGGHSC